MPKWAAAPTGKARLGQGEGRPRLMRAQLELTTSLPPSWRAPTTPCCGASRPTSTATLPARENVVTLDVTRTRWRREGRRLRAVRPHRRGSRHRTPARSRRSPTRSTSTSRRRRSSRTWSGATQHKVAPKTVNQKRYVDCNPQQARSRWHRPGGTGKTFWPWRWPRPLCRAARSTHHLTRPRSKPASAWASCPAT